MNPLTKVKLINELNEREANLGIKETVSWHSEYKDSAWIFVGGFPYELTEGDIICVFSQYGEMANINLVRDKKTGKSKGFCFICYEDQRSTILAVDNLNGIKIKGRTIRVDHVMNYRPPKDNEDLDDITKRLREEGCAPKMPDPSSSEEEEEEEYAVSVKKAKKDKKEKKKKKKEKKKEEKKKKKVLKEEQKERHPQESAPFIVKQEKEDEAYDKYNQRGAPERHGSQLRSPRDDAAFRHRHGDQRDGNREREEEEGWRDGGVERKWEGGVRNRDSWRTGREERSAELDVPPRESGDRERERPRERDRDTDRNKERARVIDRSRGMDRDRSRERDNDRNRDSDRYKHKEGGSREGEHRR